MTVPALPYAWAQQQGVLYRQQEGQHQLLFRPDASPQALLEARRVLPPCTLQPLEEAAFEQALLSFYQQGSAQARQMMEELGNEVDFFQLVETLPQDDDLLDSDDGAPVIRMINAMLAEAIKEGASDIHMALRIGGRAIDVRVSSLPTRYGERVVLRLLDKNAVKLELEKIGLNPGARQQMTRLIANPHGIILVTGPTGSGKSTTLYAALNQLNSDDRNIMTVEDPVEYELEGIGQTQVNTKVDMTFARGLRAILRQDPDVLMIGEIRDGETAQIAVQASLTGHLVLSTLHTNSAAGAIGRLRDMGVEPFLLASSLLGIVAQRLVRTLCSDCRQPVEANLPQLQQAGLTTAPPLPWHRHQPVGCERCNFSGYRGRTGIHELLLIDEPLRAAIARGDSDTAIGQLARQQQQTLRENGLEKVLSGQTTLEEVLRVTREQ